MRNKEYEMEEYEENVKDIEVTSKASKEVCLGHKMMNATEGALISEPQLQEVMMDPSFKRHSLHKKKIIHIHDRVQGVLSTALID